MKKPFVIILSLYILLVFTACGSDSSSNVSVEPGSLIDIGTYNGEPVEWVVLDSPSDGSNCNLLSTRVLYYSTYRLGENDSSRESDLIKNLNSDIVFSEEELNAVGHWFYDGEDSGNCLALTASSDFEEFL